MLVRSDRVVLLVNPYGYVQSVRNLERERRAVMPSSQRLPGAQHPARFSPRIATKLASTVRRAVPARVLAKILVWRKQRRIAALERAHLAGTQPVDSMPPAYAERFSADLDSLVRAVRSLGMEPILCTYPGLLSEAGTPEVQDACLDRRTYLIEYSCAGLVDIARQLNQETREFGEEHDLPTIDLDVVVPKDADHFADSVHLTNMGAHLVAEAVALGLAESAGRVILPADQ